MSSFRLTFTVKGKRYEQIVRANSLNDAKKMILAQFPDAKFISTGHEYM